MSVSRQGIRTGQVHSLLPPSLFRHLSNKVYVELGELGKVFRTHALILAFVSLLRFHKQMALTLKITEFQT